MTELDQRRQVPRTDLLLADPALAEPIERLGAGLVKAAIGAVQQQIRAGELPPEQAMPARCWNRCPRRPVRCGRC